MTTGLHDLLRAGTMSGGSRGTSFETTVAKNEVRGSINPFRQIVASLQLGHDLLRTHAYILREIFMVLPLKKLDTVFRVSFATGMAVCSRLLVFGLPQCQRHGYRPRSAIESNLQNVRNVVCRQVSALRPVSLDE